jgi:hypothetical protein
MNPATSRATTLSPLPPLLPGQRLSPLPPLPEGEGEQNIGRTAVAPLRIGFSRVVGEKGDRTALQGRKRLASHDGIPSSAASVVTSSS